MSQLLTQEEAKMFKLLIRIFPFLPRPDAAVAAPFAPREAGRLRLVWATGADGHPSGSWAASR
jgi:hypothetical protein